MKSPEEQLEEICHHIKNIDHSMREIIRESCFCTDSVPCEYCAQWAVLTVLVKDAEDTLTEITK